MHRFPLLTAAFGLLPLLSLGQQAPLQRFPATAVELLPGPFQQAQQTDKAYLLALDPDRLLAPYRLEAGLPSKAERYGNWENTGLDGHIGGHYLSALALMYAATHDAQVQQRLTYMVEELARCQQQNPDGYLGGVPGGRAMWQQVKAGQIKANSFGLNQKWVPWYNLHKTYAGLRDAYLIGGNAQARTMLIRLSDWCLDLTAGLSDAQIQDMLRSEHGGLNEVFADVAQLTGEAKYLKLAQRFSHQAVLTPLLARQDVLNGMHANTQIPKVIGFERVAEVGGDPAWRGAAEFFWQTVVDRRTVSIGGNSVSEHFNPAGNFTSMIEGVEGPETCNTYNMLKLTQQLYLASGAPRYLDFYERAMYNHILSSQHPAGGFVYFTPMRPRHYRVYSQPQEGFWCCVGSGLENHAKYGELVYAHRNEQELLVNLFVPSRLSWPEQGLTLTQQTTFPQEERSQLELKLKKPRTFALSIRQPGWLAAGQLTVQVNGKPVQPTATAPGYLTLTRKWRTGDVVTLALPMHTTAEALPDGSPWVSFVHGPVVLAAATDTTDLRGLRADGQRMAHVPNGPLYPLEEAPVLVTAAPKDVAAAIRPVAGQPLTFTAAGLNGPERYQNLRLVPFYQIHDARYMVYWPVTTPEGLAARTEEIRRRDAEKRALEARTIDQVTPGEQQPESDHGFRGEQTENGLHRNRHWRHAAGWFSYQLRNPERAARALRVTYAGGDKGRQFTILVNGAPLTQVTLTGNSDGSFYDVEYPLPEALRRAPAASSLTVKFEAAPGSTAGGVYDVRLLR